MMIPRDLIQSARNHQLVAFVGAGLSQPCGMPSWRELLTAMLDWEQQPALPVEERSELEEHVEAGHLLLVAEELRERMGRESFRRFIVDTVLRVEASPSAAHKALPLVPFRCVLTSNYDKLLETSYILAGYRAIRSITQEDTPELSAAQRDAGFYILHTHGVADRIDTVILGRRDYRKLLFERPAYRQYLLSLFQSKTILFLGTSLSDPDTLSILDELEVVYDGYTSPHFALLDESVNSPVERRRLERDYGIRPIMYEPSTSDHPEVKRFLLALGRELEKQVPVQVPQREQLGPERVFGRLLVDMVTPMDNKGEVNYTMARKLSKHVTGNGADGVILSAIAGEGPCLSIAERIRLVSETREELGGNTPIIAAVGETGTDESIDLAKRLEAVGASGLHITVPGFMGPSQEGIYRHCKAIADSVDLPCILYDIPQRTSVMLSVEVISRLSGVANVVGVVKAGGDTPSFPAIISEDQGNFCLWSGTDDDVLPVLSLGGYGLQSTAANLLPRTFAELIRLFLDGDHEGAANIHKRYHPLLQGLSIVSNPIPLKYIMGQIGIEVGPTRLPLSPPDATTQARLDHLIGLFRQDLLKYRMLQ